MDSFNYNYKEAEKALEKSLAQNDANYEFRNGKLIAAKGCEYSLDDFDTKLNNNVLIVGGSGTGKTECEVKPNIEQAVGSYLISDPKGLLRKQYSSYLRERGYKVVNIDFTEPKKSNGYNPLHYIHTTQEVSKLARIIVESDDVKNASVDPFWTNNAIILLEAIIAYFIETRTHQFTFKDILDMINKGDRASEDSKTSALSRIFRDHKLRNPKSWACDKFDSINSTPYKTYDCIRSSLTSSFSCFDTEELRQMMCRKSLDFAQIAQEKTAVFVTVSDTDRTMDTLVNIFFTQAMNELCSYADKQCLNGRLPIPVRFILDDFATNCRIAEFPRMISSIRSRAISVMLMIQSEAQLVQGYDYDAQTIISNCDTYIYLGGNDVQTAQAVADRCDKPMNEILNMPIGSCWVFRRGDKPRYGCLEYSKVIEQIKE